MLSKKSIELQNRCYKEMAMLLPKVLRNLQRIHECAMKNEYKLKGRR